METLTGSSVMISLVCITLMTVLLKAVNWVWLRPKKLERLLRQQGLSGNSYRLFFGDLKDMSSMRTEAMKFPMNVFSNDYFPRVEPLRYQLQTKYGKDFFLWFGPTPAVHLSNPEFVREAFTKTQEFGKPKLNPLFHKLLPGLVSYEGEKWAKHRKLINPAFHVEKLKLMLPAFRDSCAEIINKWEMLVGESGSVDINVLPDLTKLSADVISRAAFGSNYEEGQRIFELLKEQTALVLVVMQSVYIPGRSYLPTATNRRFKKLEEQIDSLLRTIIKKRKEEMETGEQTKEDLLGILMHSNFKEFKDRQVGMTLEDVIDECKLFYLAGQETTSTLLVWTLILLSKHHDWQEQAREEVLQTFGDSEPDFEGLSSLKTVTMILYEVLRLYPPVFRLARKICNEKGVNLGTLTIPCGALVTFSLQTIHQDEELWGNDAQEFNPERFAQGISKAAKGTNSFYPFGWGPRICAGEKFAITEAKLALAMILQRFSFVLSPSYVHAPINAMFTLPQYGAQIILKRC